MRGLINYADKGPSIYLYKSLQRGIYTDKSLKRGIYTDKLLIIIRKFIPQPHSYLLHYQGGGKRGHIVADTLLRTQMFPRLPARAAFVANTKMFLISFRKILCPQQMFPGLHSTETIMSNNVSATLCPRCHHLEALPP